MQSGNILQTYLDEVAAAVMADDWPAYAARVCLPFHLVTHVTNITITTAEDLRTGFHAFVQTLRTQHVTDYIRLVDSSNFANEGLITGDYTSHLLANGHRILPPFPSQIVLRHEDGIWRAASITNPLANSRWPILLPSTITRS